MFKPNALYFTDGYKIGHKAMLAKGTTKLYGTWIPRSVKYAPKGITKVVSFGQQLTWRWIHDLFQESFFERPESEIQKFVDDMNNYLGLEYDGSHFMDLWKIGYLPIKVKSLPEGIETNPNIPHMTFVNTIDGFAWLTLYLETIVSSLSWKAATSATLSLQYRRNTVEWVNKTAKDQDYLIPYMCHNFSARGMSPFDMIASALGHDVSFDGDDTLVSIPAIRYFYNIDEDSMPVNSVNASEHSVSTTKIFTVGEQQMIADWLVDFPKGILSIVSDTFDLWKLITEYLPANKEAIMARDGKLVIRPDSGDPVSIICGSNVDSYVGPMSTTRTPEFKGVVELLWDIFGGTVNEQGYKVLDPHIGAIYGDSITLERQVQIYERLAAKGFAATNIVLGVGSFTYQYNTRDTFGFAAKGAWFEVTEQCEYHKHLSYEKSDKIRKSYNIYKDPITDDGTKKSLKGLLQVFNNNPNCNGGNILFDGKDEFIVNAECTSEQESGGLLKVIYEDGMFFNQRDFNQIRDNIKKLC